MELEVLYIMLTVLIGSIIAATVLVFFYQRKVVTRNPQAQKGMVVGGGLCLFIGAILILFAFRTLIFMAGFMFIVIGLLLIIGAVWSVLYTMKEMISMIRRVAEDE